MAERQSDDHIVTLDGGAASLCLRCGATIRMALPISVRVWCAANRAFIAEHRACRDTTGATPKLDQRCAVDEKAVVMMEAAQDQTIARLRDFLANCQDEQRDRAIERARCEFRGPNAQLPPGSPQWFTAGCTMVGLGIVLAAAARHMTESEAGRG